MRALIVKTSAFGDVVQAFPVVEYLKSRQHISHVGWVVEKKAASLVRAHPLVDTVIEIDSSSLRSLFPRFDMFREWGRQRTNIRENCWDCVFDLQANIKSGCATWNARSPTKVGYGRHTVAEWPNILATSERVDPPSGLSIREEYLYIVQQHFQDSSSFEASPVELRLTEPQERSLAIELSRWPRSIPIWFVSVGSTWPNKMCRTQTFLDVLRRVKEKYSPYFIFIAGNGEELREVGALAKDFPSSSHMLFRPDLPFLQRAMNHAHAVLAVDSIILHLGATAQTPTFGFFGPSSAMKYAPKGKRHGFFQSTCPSNTAFEKRCPFLRTCQTGQCLKGADPEDIFRSIEEWQTQLLPILPLD
jgi:heptosyltransferase-1